MASYLDKNPFTISLIIVLVICSIVMVIFGDPITRILAIASAWASGVATKSLKGN